MDASAVHAHADARRGDSVDLLRRLIRQPSVSSQNRGVRECAALIVERMQSIGIDAGVLETAGQPVVFGELRAARAGAPTLLIYNHYDVQPEEPLDEWRHPPFAAEIDGDRIIGRGATDAKGNLVCHLAAAEAFLHAAGSPPINLKFLFDGEEESGSPSLPAFVEANRDRLRCDYTLSFDGGFDPSDRPTITLGSSGLVYVHLDCRGATKDLHSARARLVPNPAWRIVWALGTLKGADERITIDGFYDDVLPPDPDERRLLDEYAWDNAAQRRHLGVDQFLTGVAGTAALERLLFQPTCNIAGFAAGYAGEGTKTVLPHRARAHLDFRLVWRQDPNDVLTKLSRHLERHGYGDIRVTPHSLIEPSRAPVGSGISRAVIEAARVTYQPASPLVKPRAEASGRQACWLGARLGVAGVATGVGPPDWLGHAPNEFMTLTHFCKGIHYAINIWSRLGAEG
jgi:acetylornithine deacetylase/succinyl-diaminopimelate desuccinylase-like protein